jgi:site-specific recombinase XerD
VKDVARYIRQRQDAGAAPNTIHKELATLFAIFRFALQEEIVLFNPVLAVKKPKLKLVRPNYTPTPAQIILILNAINPKVRRFFLAYCSSGCRKSELIRCNVGDADLENRLLRVIGKGNKECFIPMNDILFEQVKAELELRHGARPDEPLFINKEGRRFRTLRMSLERACKKAQGAGHRPSFPSPCFCYCGLSRKKGHRITFQAPGACQPLDHLEHLRARRGRKNAGSGGELQTGDR